MTTSAQSRSTQKSKLSKRQLTQLFMRIGDTIAEETAVLRKNPAADMTAANARKNRCLYELNIVSRELARFEIDTDTAKELARLRVRVEENEAVIKARLEATREVVRILGDVITDADSDGTYPSIAGLPAGYA